jgi:outer membrane protein assembly factor BamB
MLTPRRGVLKPLLTYYTGVVPRAVRTSSDCCARAAPCPGPGARPGRRVVVALLFLLGLSPWARAQELAFPGGVIWQLRIDPPPGQLPAFDDLSAYLVLRDGTVSAIDHATGTTRWTTPAASTVRPDSSGRHLAGADSGTAWAVDALSGRTAWQHDLGSNVAAPPVAASAGAVFLTDGGDLVLLAWDGGRETWRAPMPAAVSAPPAASGDRVWVGLEDGRVLAIRIADGAIAWTTPLGARVLGMTAIGDRLFVGSSDDFLYALKVKDGGIAWRWRTGGDVTGHAVADERRVYFTSRDAMLRAVDRRHGDLRWQRPLATRAVGEPLLAGTQVIVAGVSPELRAYRTSDGGMTASVSLPGRPLHGPFLAPEKALAPVRLVVLSAGGHLMAIGQTVEPMLVPWDAVPGKKLPPEVLTVIRKD